MKPSLLTLLLVTVCSAGGQDVQLPQGFPDPYGTDATNGPHAFLTTRAYSREARRLLLQEATQVATDLGLPEPHLPLTEDVVKFNVAPFGMAYINKSVGSVATWRYHYMVHKGWKFNHLLIAQWSTVCADYVRNYRWPSSRLDTNAAYSLATQWLAAVSMDVAGLNRDCVMHAAPATHWNRFRWNTPFTNATFTPIYNVYWIPRQSTNTNNQVAATVELFAPDKTLLALSVEDPKYILRKPLQFTNLDKLLANPITVQTMGMFPDNSSRTNGLSR